MPQEVFRQANFTNGELDPKELGRRELKAYFASLMGAENLLQTPQGPIGRRPGLSLVGPIRNPMAAIDISAATVTAPNGGTVTHVIDGAGAGPVSTTGMSTTDPYVFLHIDLGAPTEVSAVDLVNVAVIPAGGSGDGSGYTPPPPIHAPYGGLTGLHIIP